MSNIKTFQCPNCGSPVTTTGTEKEVQCAYCGSTVIVPEELRQAPPPQPMEINFGQTSQPSDQGFQSMETADKAAGATIGFTAMGFILPVVLTCVILAAVGGILFYVFSNVNSGIKQQTDQTVGTAPAPANQVPTLAVPASAVATEAIPTPSPFSNVILQDDFTDPSSGWSRVKNQDYVLEYKDGHYHILVSQPSDGHAVWVGSSYTNISVEADAQETAGPDDGTIGVACRATKSGGMYSFEFDQNGDYGIYKYDSDGNSDALTEGTLNPNTVTQNDVNHVEGVCDGDTLTLLLNDQVLAQVQDSTYTKGGVGMIVTSGASGNGGMDVLFGDFLVKGP
ncbi:MAG TPA: hypothetical protein VLZ89_11960 [Anaerolineales bacterium]|nr:hypothetical protein [Anaerolineales bacterium]